MTDSSSSLAVTIDDVHSAAARIRPFVHRTPILRSAAINDMTSRELFFKCENFQRMGAFKYRGATNAVQSLSNDEAVRGVVTHSSGNHAQALALAASVREIDAHIVMPCTAPRVKRAAVAGYGGRIYECGPTLEAREAMTHEVQKKTGATLVHPYNNPAIIAGQGTCALEMLEQMQSDFGVQPDAIIAPIGGGGLMSGTCITARALLPSCLIIGAEPSGADDAARSLASGALVPSLQPRTIADGLLTSLGDLTWPIIRAHVNAIVTVSDAEIIAAMRLIWERMKIIIEPSAATVLAVVMSAAFREQVDSLARVGVILSGGNVDLDHLPWQE
ncbi:MAG: pyridoxal-phosphate dependent enzyme [Phycisphaerales bacterium]